MANKDEKILKNEGEKRVPFKDFAIEKPIIVTRRIAEDLQLLRTRNSTMNFDGLKEDKSDDIEMQSEEYEFMTEINRENKGEERLRTEEPMEYIANSINNLGISVMQLSQATVLSSYTIAKALMYQSHIISTSIDKLTNEIERKNKLDEYYMLLDKIERYENTLIEMGVIQEVYNNLRIVVYPTIELDNRSIYLLSKFRGRMLNKVLQLSGQKRKSPIIVLADLLTNMDYYVVPAPDDRDVLLLAYSSGDYVKEEDTLIVNDQLWYFDYKTKDYKFKFLKKNMFLGYRSCLELYIKLQGGDYIRCIKLETKNSENIGTLIVENLYNDIVSTENEREIRVYSQTSFSAIKEQIDMINQEIEMENLRSLYISLRGIVKDYKIRGVMEE